jgi:hypothetical protein
MISLPSLKRQLKHITRDTPEINLLVEPLDKIVEDPMSGVYIITVLYINTYCELVTLWIQISDQTCYMTIR